MEDRSNYSRWVSICCCPSVCWTKTKKRGISTAVDCGSKRKEIYGLAKMFHATFWMEIMLSLVVWYMRKAQLAKANLSIRKSNHSEWNEKSNECRNEHECRRVSAATIDWGREEYQPWRNWVFLCGAHGGHKVLSDGFTTVLKRPQSFKAGKMIGGLQSAASKHAAIYERWLSKDKVSDYRLCARCERSTVQSSNSDRPAHEIVRHFQSLMTMITWRRETRDS